MARKKKDAPKEPKEEIAPPPSVLVMPNEVTDDLASNAGELLKQISILKLRLGRMEAVAEYWKERAVKAEGK